MGRGLEFIAHRIAELEEQLDVVKNRQRVDLESAERQGRLADGIQETIADLRSVTFGGAPVVLNVTSHYPAESE